MPNKLKGLRITSVDLVDNPANPYCRVHLFKRGGAGGDSGSAGIDGGGESVADALVGGGEGIIQKIASAIASALPKKVQKEARTFGDELDRDMLDEITGQSWEYCHAMSVSLASIICDGEISGGARESAMHESLAEFAEALRGAIPDWAEGRKHIMGDGPVAKSAAQRSAPEAPQGFPGGNGQSAAGAEGDIGGSEYETEGMNTVNIDITKMTPEERATLAGFEKKYGIAAPGAAGTGGGDMGEAVTGTGSANGAEAGASEGAGAAASGNGAGTAAGGNGTGAPVLQQDGGAAPAAAAAADDVQKSQAARIEELEKKLELAALENAAKKYESIGKRAGELAPKLYEMKKAGGTAYADYVALLDEQTALVEKSGLFSEIGKNTGGTSGSATELGAKAAEIRKSNPDLGMAEALAKAYEENPRIAEAYDKEYMTGGDF